MKSRGGLSRRWDDEVQETWFDAGMRSARLHDLGNEFTALYANARALGLEEADAAITALRELRIEAPLEGDDDGE